MMFELVILFTGLCAYVPEYPVTPETYEGNQMSVLMPMAPDHVPILLVREENVVGAVPTICSWKEAKSFRYLQCDLKHRLVTVFPARQDRLAFALKGYAAEKECPDRRNATDFSWVVAMDKVHGSDVSAASNCVFHPEVEPLRMMAQVLLTEGIVTVGSFSRLGYDNGDIAIWELQPSGIRQALADVVRVDRRVSATRISFAFQDLGSHAWEELVLQKTDGQVVVEIKNVAVDDICRVGIDGSRFSEKGLMDHHFKHLDKLLSGYGHSEAAIRVVSGCEVETPETEGFCLRIPVKKKKLVGDSASLHVSPDEVELVGNPQCPGASADPPGP